MKLTKVYAFTINLERSPERYKYIKQQADKNGLNLKRIQAIDGSKIPKSELIQYQNQHKFSHHYLSLSSGEIGCSMSWQKAWKLASESEEKSTVVLEDDVEIFDNIKKVVHSLLGNEDIIIDLSGRKGFLERERRIVNGITMIRYSSPPLGNIGAIYGRKASKILLNKISVFSAPCDNLRQMIWLHGVKTWSLEFGCLTHSTDIGESTIGHSKISRIKKFRREFMTPFWRSYIKIRNLLT